MVRARICLMRGVKSTESVLIGGSVGNGSDRTMFDHVEHGVLKLGAGILGHGFELCGLIAECKSSGDAAKAVLLQKRRKRGKTGL